MTAFIDSMWFNAIPQDIMRECILPYTYNPQPSELCEDIRDYFESSNQMFDLYLETHRTPQDARDWLSNDICRFMNQDQATMWGYTDFFIQFYRRVYLMRDADRAQIAAFIERTLNFPFPIDINRHIAMMTPPERKQLWSYLTMVVSTD